MRRGYRVEKPAVPAIELIGVSKNFEAVQAVDNISLSIPAGEITGIQGPAGAGKTTLLELIGAQTTPSRGTISVLGRPRRERRLRALVGFVPTPARDLNRLDDTHTAMEVLQFHAALVGLPKRKRDSRVIETLERIRLSKYEAYHVQSLPGEMKRKLAIGRALMLRPSVLCIDDFTAGVDTPGYASLMGLVAGLRHEGLTLLLSTREEQEARDICDRVIFLRAGAVHDSIRRQELERGESGCEVSP